MRVPEARPGAAAGSLYLLIALLVFVLWNGARLALGTVGGPLGQWFLGQGILLAAGLLLVFLLHREGFFARPAPEAGGGLLKRAALGAAVYPFLVPGLILVHEAAMSRQEDPEAMQHTMHLFKELQEASRTPVLAAMGVCVVVLVPLYEELLFRGAVQRGFALVLGGRLAGRGGDVAALVVAAAFFTAVHDPFTWVTVGVLGLILGWLRLATGGLAAPVAFHMCHNLAVLLLQA